MLVQGNTVTKALIILCGVVYLALAVLSGDPLYIDWGLLALVGQWNRLVYQGCYWQLVTSVFVHANLLHLGLNMFYLYIVGTRLERYLGGGPVLGTFMACALAGNLLSLLSGPDVVSVGSSGGVLGLFAFELTYLPALSGASMGPALAQLALLFILNSLIPGADILAHLGGMVAGALLGLAAARRRRAVLHKVCGYPIG